MIELSSFVIVLVYIVNISKNVIHTSSTTRITMTAIRATTSCATATMTTGQLRDDDDDDDEYYF